MAESRANKRARITGKVTPLEKVPGKPDASPRVKFTSKKKPKAPKRPTPVGPANKGRPKGKVAPIENDHSGKKPPKKGTQVVKKKPSTAVAKRNPTQPAKSTSTSNSVSNPSTASASGSGKPVANNPTAKRVLKTAAKVVKPVAMGALAATAAVTSVLPFDQASNRSDSKKAQRKEGYTRPHLGPALEKMVDPSFAGGSVKKGAPGGPTPGASKPKPKYKYNQRTRPEAFDTPNTPRSKFGMPPKKPTSPVRKTDIDTESYAGTSKVTGAAAPPAPPKISKVGAGIKNSPDMFSQFMANLTGVKVTPSRTGAGGEREFVAHDTDGTTARNQTGGPLFGAIKNKKKGSK